MGIMHRSQIAAEWTREERYAVAKYEDEGQNEPRNKKKKKKKDNLWGRCLAEGQLEDDSYGNFRASEMTCKSNAYRGGSRICNDSKGLSTGLGSLKKT